MEKKTIGIIMQAVATFTSMLALGLLIKWHPIHVLVIIIAAIVGFIGNKFYREG